MNFMVKKVVIFGRYAASWYLYFTSATLWDASLPFKQSQLAISSKQTMSKTVYVHIIKKYNFYIETRAFVQIFPGKYF